MVPALEELLELLLDDDDEALEEAELLELEALKLLELEEDDAVDELEALLLLDELLLAGGGGGVMTEEELLELLCVDALALLESEELAIDELEELFDELLGELAGAGGAFCVTGTWPHATSAASTMPAARKFRMQCAQLLGGFGAGVSPGSCQTVPIDGKRAVMKRATAG